MFMGLRSAIRPSVAVKTTANIGLKDYPIYTLGFGNSDQSILQRIADDSHGEAKFIESPGAIATNFFEVLRMLKNSQTVFNESLYIQGEHAIPFSVDSYTSQVTMVLANENAGLDVPSCLQMGKRYQNFGVQRTIIIPSSLNQHEKELTGEWVPIVNGAGNVQLFGDRTCSSNLDGGIAGKHAASVMNHLKSIAVLGNCP
jgi:hypothetical protein